MRAKWRIPAAEDASLHCTGSKSYLHLPSYQLTPLTLVLRIHTEPLSHSFTTSWCLCPYTHNPSASSRGDNDSHTGQIEFMSQSVPIPFQYLNCRHRADYLLVARDLDLETMDKPRYLVSMYSSKSICNARVDISKSSCSDKTPVSFLGTLSHSLLQFIAQEMSTCSFLHSRSLQQITQWNPARTVKIHGHLIPRYNIISLTCIQSHYTPTDLWFSCCRETVTANLFWSFSDRVTHHWKVCDWMAKLTTNWDSKLRHRLRDKYENELQN